MRQVVCNLCGSDKSVFFLNGKDRLLAVDTTVFTLVRCWQCGLVYTNPQPSFQELQKYYPADYPPYAAEYKAFSEGPAIRAARRLKRLFKKEAPAPAAEIPDASKRTVLDFGCGGGGFLQQLRKRHPRWTLVGFDISTNPISETVGGSITLYKDSFERLSATFKPETFDTIYLNNVLEHLATPKETLTALARLLKPGGQMVIEVPNIDSRKRKIFGKYFSSLDIPRHLYHFNTQTLGQMCHEAGLTPRDCKLTGSAKSTVRSLYYALGIRSKTLNPFLYAFFKTAATITGLRPDDAIHLVAIK